MPTVSVKALKTSHGSKGGYIVKRSAIQRAAKRGGTTQKHYRMARYSIEHVSLVASCNSPVPLSFESDVHCMTLLIPSRPAS